MQRLGLPAQLRWGLRTTNAIEALNSQLRFTVRRVSRFTTGDQALEVLVSRLDEATARAS
jgi:transposase-like protein